MASRRGSHIIEFVQRGSQVLLTAVLANDTSNETKLRFADDEQSKLNRLKAYLLIEQTCAKPLI